MFFSYNANVAGISAVPILKTGKNWLGKVNEFGQRHGAGLGFDLQS